jgi:hypothetical protein
MYSRAYSIPVLLQLKSDHSLILTLFHSGNAHLKRLVSVLILMDSKIMFLANILFTPVSKATLFALSVDRLYAVIAPFRYRSRNHMKFAIKAFIGVYTFGLIVTAVSLYYLRASATVIENCSSINKVEPAAASIITAVMLFVDLNTYILNIVLVVLLRCRKSNSLHKIGSTAAIAEMSRQVL